MSMEARMIPAEFTYLLHLAKDGRDLYARGIKAAANQAQATAGAVVSHVVAVNGQVVDAMGQPMSGVFDIVAKVYPPTSGQGLITALGSPVGTIKQGSGTVEIWMQTSATGAFGFQVTDTTGGELALLSVHTSDSLMTKVELQF